ncbi:UDP-N-acetylmuramate dehydrogenase [Porcipelethomonas sp.]|uniref:UDP-N-acetylmuramate dehydrogenase n=1 Tax=Porcipelethomonas sp. TaxID=2981675 RepID=UPI003EFA3E41
MPYISELQNLCSRLRCECRLNEPLKEHTTFKIGGDCRAMIFINSTESLSEIIRFSKAENAKIFIMGRGSNILASDSGFDGIVLLIGKDFSDIKQVNQTEIHCLAGTSLKDVCLFALEHSFTGMEFAYGIPGTAGGALYMNAGAYGGEMKDIVKSAGCIDINGNRKIIESEKMNLSYRHSVFAENQGMIITDMTLRLEKGNYDDIKSRMQELIKKRRDKQPLEFPSAGSTFKRPEGSYASLLIEQCGLKGMTVGGAQVSEKHSGFVINKGGATFKDVIELTDKVKECVLEKTGYKLELEPVILK